MNQSIPNKHILKKTKFHHMGMNLSPFTYSQSFTTSLQQKRISMVIGYQIPSQNTRVKYNRFTRRLALGEAPDHVIGGDKRWVLDCLKNGEWIGKWGWWGESKRGEEVTREAGIGSKAGDNDLSVGLLGLVDGRAWWEGRQRRVKCSRCWEEEVRIWELLFWERKEGFGSLCKHKCKAKSLCSNLTRDFESLVGKKWRV